MQRENSVFVTSIAARISSERARKLEQGGLVVRTRVCLGAVFGGQTGLFGGVAIAPDGSNINAVTPTVLNARNPVGSLVIPSPQIAGTGVNYGVPTTMRSE